MPYPESCPECGGVFRNTGTHFTARRNEIGRHVLLELGCQTTSRRFWWDFTTGGLTEDGRPSPMIRASSAARVGVAAATNGLHHPEANGHLSEITARAMVSTLEPPPAPTAGTEPTALVGSDANATTGTEPTALVGSDANATTGTEPTALVGSDANATTGTEPTALVGSDANATAGTQPIAEVGTDPQDSLDANSPTAPEITPPALAQEETLITEVAELAGPEPVAAAPLKDAFVRQLQLDRLTLRQMRSWLMSDEARRAIEVAAGATEATYERLALILFGADLPHLLGKESAVPPSTGMSAEERLELQREKARIRARVRRAAAKAARQQS
jgi:hypothetical protein